VWGGGEEATQGRRIGRCTGAWFLFFNAFNMFTVQVLVLVLKQYYRKSVGVLGCVCNEVPLLQQRNVNLWRMVVMGCTVMVQIQKQD
jgi:hypothetical protein